MMELMEQADRQAVNSSAAATDVPHMVQAMLELHDSWAAYILRKNLNCDTAEFWVKRKNRGAISWSASMTCSDNTIRL